jgi:aminoglycoside phosphotransferase (APT) family kinase protein
VDLSYLTEQRQRYAQAFRVRPAHLDDTLGEGPIRDVLEAVWPLPSHNPPVLLHGDFWPGNLLWHNDQLVGILDWEDATIGDPLEDLANSRLEILWASGRDAMQQFTDAYQSLNPIHLVNLPYWDLCAALRPAFKIDDWAADEQAARTMRERHGWFIAQAFERLSDQR